VKQNRQIGLKPQTKSGEKSKRQGFLLEEKEQGGQEPLNRI
jgi:hypothetical protein